MDSVSMSQSPFRIARDDDEDYYDPTIIHDDVHGHIEIDDRIRPIIDTPQFQRLRDLKQLGASYFVFPGASHNRFEHSLGVMHLASRLMSHLASRQPKLDITVSEYFCVTVAGLLHDLGHGPFSHVFDNEFLPSVRDPSEPKFRHEDMSVQMVQCLFEENEIAVAQEEVTLIQALISPSTHSEIVAQYRQRGKGFLFEIVANENSGIDVDKWDYMLRDSRNCNLGISFNFERLLRHARVIGDHICYHEKTNYDIYMMFRTRYELFKRVYSHKTAKSIEYMICDVFRNSCEVFDIVGKIHSPQTFMELSDSILHRIEFTMDDRLATAQDILRRLRKRQLYKCAGYSLVDPNDFGELKPRQIEEKWREEMFQMFSELSLSSDEVDGEQEELTLDGVSVQLQSLSYGMEDRNPINQVHLFKSSTPNSSYLVKANEISLMHGSSFREWILRLYVKNRAYAEPGRRVFKKFCDEKHLTSVLQIRCLSPSRGRSEDRSAFVPKDMESPMLVKKTMGRNYDFQTPPRRKRVADGDE